MEDVKEIQEWFDKQRDKQRREMHCNCVSLPELLPKLLYCIEELQLRVFELEGGPDA